MYKKRIAIILCLVMSLPVLAPVYAQGQAPPFPPLPLQNEYTRDTLHWFSPAQAQEINSVAGKLDLDGLSVIAVVTLDDCGLDKAQYKTDLFRAWKIGHASTNDGLLILVCWYGGDKSRRSLEQETGTGLEATVTDIQTSRIARQYFVPAFQEDADPIASGRAGQALVDMVNAYDVLLRGKSLPMESQPLPVASRDPAIAFLGITGALVLIIVGFFVRAFIKNVNFKNKRTRAVAIFFMAYALVLCVLAYYDLTWALIAIAVGVVILIIFFNPGGSGGGSSWDNSSNHDSSRSDMGGGTSEGGGSSTKF